MAVSSENVLGTLGTRWIAFIALGVSILSTLWTIGWSWWRHRRATSAKVTVEVSFRRSDRTGRATVMVIEVTNGPYRATTLRRVRIEPAGQEADLDVTSPNKVTSRQVVYEAERVILV
jgi:hypothetical protein